VVRTSVSSLLLEGFRDPSGPRNPSESVRAMSNQTHSTATLSQKCRDNSSTRTTCSPAMTVEPLVNRNPGRRPLRRRDSNRSGRLLLPCFFSLRAQLPAAALPTPGRAHPVPGVALHAAHLVQSQSLGLRDAGHHG